MKIKNDATDQWLAVSVELKSGATSTGTTALLSDGLSTIHTGTAGGATVTVSEATVKAGGVLPLLQTGGKRLSTSLLRLSN